MNGMNRLTSQILPLVALAVIASPVVTAIFEPDEPPEPVRIVRAPDPAPIRPETDPGTWFEKIRPHCTPAEATLFTDLNPPPEGVEGTGYKAACLALAQSVPRARALLLALPAEVRLQGASMVFDVAQGLSTQGRYDRAGPLMELVLEFWPNHYQALYAAGTARFMSGDPAGAQLFLGRFREVYLGDDSLVHSAKLMLGDTAQP